MTADLEHRWRGRPVMSACLRFFVFLSPIGASVATAAAIAPRLHAERWYQLIGNIFLVFAASTLALVLTDRLARRLLPLAVLLRLSLAFPDEAPSRIAIARRTASTGHLEERLEAARRDGVDDEPTRAAEQILTLVAAVEAHDRATRGHSERVRIYTDLLADQLGLSQDDRDRLRWSALLHDVGKLTVPGKVLNNPSKLDGRE
ncbi:MAG: HD-GYP domain-containing protein, partial [Gammaproteobacteria bacterium]